MPLRNGRLTPREVAFSSTYARTGDLSYSSHRAGYASSAGGVNALQRQSVKDRIAKIREERVPGLFKLSIDTLEDVMRDPGAPASAKVAAADKGMKASHAYAPGQHVETPTEELDPARMLERVDKRIVDLIESRPGEFGPALDDEPEDEAEDEAEDAAAVIAEGEGIFG